MCTRKVVVPAPHSSQVGGRLQHFASVWKQNLQLSRWHSRALEEGVPIEWCQDYKPGTYKPFDSARRYRVDSKERQSCSKTLQHYLDIGAVEVLPPDTQDGLWHTFFPVPKKGTDKVRGCIDLRKVNQHIVYRHFKMHAGEAQCSSRGSGFSSASPVASPSPSQAVSGRLFLGVQGSPRRLFHRGTALVATADASVERPDHRSSPSALRWC